jgi:hypothetical protein
MICIQCKSDFEAKRADARFCSSTCRSRFKRNATDNCATDNATDNLELCRVCQVELPPLESPRKHRGMCINCVTKKYGLKQGNVSQHVA